MWGYGEMKALRLLLFGACMCLAFPRCLSNKLVMILLDGFRWDYTNIHGMGLRGFPKLVDSGTKAEYMVVDFPTLSYPNYYTVMTGLYDEVHGMVGNYMYDEKEDAEFLIGTNPEYNQSYWWNGGDPLWITATRQNKRAHMYFWPNCEVVIRGLLPAACRPYSGVPTQEDFHSAVHEGVSLLADDRTDFIGIYFELTDRVGHDYGPRSPELRQVIRHVDDELAWLMAELARRGLTDEVDLVLFSDHGMSDISPERTVRLDNCIDMEDVERVLGSGPFLSIWPKEGKLEKVYNELKMANEHISVYKKENAPSRWHYSAHYRIAPIFICMENGWMLLKTNQSFPYKNNTQPLGGNHGYDNGEEDMRGIFMATGPTFKTGHVSKPIHAVDVYQLMCNVLNIKPSPNNGTWDHVTDMLRSSRSASVQVSSIDLCPFLFMISTYIVSQTLL